MKLYAAILVITGYSLLSAGMSVLDKQALKTCERNQEIQRAIDPASVNDGECAILLVK